MLSKAGIRWATFAAFFAVASTLAIVSGCGPAGELPPGPTGPPVDPQSPHRARVLVSADSLGTYSASQVTSRDPATSDVSAWIQHGITTWAIEYDTFQADGTPIIASGAVMIPNGAGGNSWPLIVYHHGTLLPSEEPFAPSYDHSGNFETWVTAAVLAASGRVVLVPDYLGYGASSGVEHPYEHSESQANACGDAIAATLDHLGDLSMSATNQLVLVGFSEGASAALATHRRLEALPSPPRAPSMSIALAGGYAKSVFADSLLGSSDPVPDLRLAVWAVRTYDRLYDLDRPMSAYFLSPWDSAITNDPFVSVPNIPTSLFEPAFAAGVRNGTDAAFETALDANDVHDWAPIAPVWLLHGEDDLVVPAFLSQLAAATMSGRGGDVTLETWPGLDHDESGRELARRVLEILDVPTGVPGR